MRRAAGGVGMSAGVPPLPPLKCIRGLHALSRGKGDFFFGGGRSLRKTSWENQEKGVSFVLFLKVTNTRDGEVYLFPAIGGVQVIRNEHSPLPLVLGEFGGGLIRLSWCTYIMTTALLMGLFSFLCCPIPTDRKMRKNNVGFVFFFFFFFYGPDFCICVLTAFRPSFPHLETLNKIIGKRQLCALYRKKKKKKKNPLPTWPNSRRVWSGEGWYVTIMTTGSIMHRSGSRNTVV